MSFRRPVHRLLFATWASWFLSIVIFAAGATGLSTGPLVARQQIKVPDCFSPCAAAIDFAPCNNADGTCLCQLQTLTSPHKETAASCAETNCEGADEVLVLRFIQEAQSYCDTRATKTPKPSPPAESTGENKPEPSTGDTDSAPTTSAHGAMKMVLGGFSIVVLSLWYLS